MVACSGRAVAAASSCLGDDIGVTEAGRPVWSVPSLWAEPGWEPWVWGPATSLTSTVLVPVLDPTPGDQRGNGRGGCRLPLPGELDLGGRNLRGQLYKCLLPLLIVPST